MRTIALFIILFLSAQISLAQQVPCFHHKNGKYKIIDSAHKSVIIVDRFDSVETQYIYHGDTSQYQMKLVFKVEWLNDCTYKLYLVYNIIHTHQGDMHLPTEHRTQLNKIVAADQYSYIVHTELNDFKKTRFSNLLIRIQ